MLLLKKKRYQEQLLDKTENQISNLERMVSQAWGCSGLGLPWDVLELHSIPAARSWQVFSPLSKGKHLQNCACATIFPGDTEWRVWNLQLPC